MNDLNHNEEQKLNPPPASYKVSQRVKMAFVACALVGCGVYGYMLLHRRIVENEYVSHQEIAPIKLMPSLMPAFTVMDARSLVPEHLQFVGGSYTLLNIWATWCPPCQKEMPSLQELQARLQGKLRIIALSIDDDQTALTDFLAAQQLNLTVLWDKDKISLKHLGVEKYPESFLISPEGYLITQFSGPRDWASPAVVDYFLNVVR